MGFELEVTIPAITVFLQGILSFLSPCVLPMIPLYIGYLSGGTLSVGSGGEASYDRKKVFLNTLFFVFGTGFAFLLLGLGASAAGSFFAAYRNVLIRAGGILILFFGLLQLGLFSRVPLLNREARLSLPLEKMTMSPLTAFLMGFLFSFAWTPCVGPALAAVLLMAASAASRTRGLLLIGLYTLGFTLPFLAVGLFASALLSFFKTHKNVMPVARIIGGVLLVLTGLLMLTGKLSAISAFFSSL